MAWGFFKKMIIADRLAVLVNTIYNDPHSFSGFPLIVATICFAYQIYCDFSGYSDIARGAAQTMGFKLMLNFDRPYFSKTVSEFWQRWHISLSTWFRDYLYIPLGGNRVSKLRWSFNILITFLISGLWHGANWTYLAWGGLHAAYMIVEFHIHKHILRINNFLKTFTTFGLVCFAWIFFRANSLHDALYISQHLGDGLGFVLQQLFHFKITAIINLFLVPGETELRLSLHEFGIAITGIVLMELAHLSQDRINFMALLNRQPRMIRWSFYYAVAFCLMILGVWLNDLKFIYFQF
jgi:D-alanyl-lipoteichoic acid acyltransferase DltB (MBOAT superfamily)